MDLGAIQYWQRWVGFGYNLIDCKCPWWDSLLFFSAGSHPIFLGVVFG
jgi:hypothetical protein